MMGPIGLIIPGFVHHAVFDACATLRGRRVCSTVLPPNLTSVVLRFRAGRAFTAAILAAWNGLAAQICPLGALSLATSSSLPGTAFRP
jgi:hypothetical protein